MNLIGLISSSDITQHCGREHIGSVSTHWWMVLSGIWLVWSPLLTSLNIVKTNMLGLLNTLLDDVGWIWLVWYPLLTSPNIVKTSMLGLLSALLDNVGWNLIGLISSSKITQHCWNKHAGFVWIPCWMVLSVISLVWSPLLSSPNTVKRNMLGLFEYSSSMMLGGMWLV